MKVTTTAIDDFFSPLRQYFLKNTFTREEVDTKPPLRSELFSLDQLEHHAKQLAGFHKISHKQTPELLLKRLADNEEVLSKVTALLHETVQKKAAITPAGQWLLDNYYLIEEQIRTGKRYLPKGYSKGLPKLSTGTMAGYPRVYDIAIEIISHSDGHIDINSLSSFLAAYQKVSYLTIGELWAIPIMLRLALLENLRRVAARIAIDRIDASVANHWAKKIIEVSETSPKDLVLIIADMARSNPPMVSAFVAEFARKIQWKGPDLTLPLTWVEQHLNGTAHTINSMVLSENQKQAADQLSVSNSINSLRFLAKMDWREFVETMSVVEQTLRHDPQGTYSKMDFYTRDHYRHQVEKMAKRSDASEKEVAEVAVELAEQSITQQPEDKRRAHVGYYLIDKGVPLTEKKIKIKLTTYQALTKVFHQSIPALYWIASFLLTAGIGAFLFSKGYAEEAPLWFTAGLGLLILLSASQLAMAFVNWWTTSWVVPKPLPKMDFSTGIPSESRTMVVVPTLLATPAQADKLVDDLEVRFLANREPNLLFALLTDFRDAHEEVMPQDEHLVAVVSNRIRALNERYGREDQQDTFFLFHRPRKYNPVEKIWMGYERKRGKLSELNHLLRGTGHENFSAIVGDEHVYKTVKYIISLDTDTQLPRDAAWRLTGLMAHPLNEAVYDEKKQRVTEGYGIIQPRIAISLHGAVRSAYSKMNENDSGIDPYTRVTSDIYQDVFQEGSFIGKGIYDLDVFEKAVNNRFPENRILSHDLLEGSYARSGFASDVQLYEEYPSRYDADISRRHRWVRGDWQIANWFLPWVPGAKKGYVHNPVSALSKWKIFDNLRRSLVPIALLLMLLLGWTVLPHAWFWTTAVVMVMMLPSLVISVWNAVRKPKEIAIQKHLSNAIGATHKNILQALFNFMCLPYEAFVSLDAITRTLWRIYISRKRLLEWNPSGFSASQKAGLAGTFVKMWTAPVMALALFYYLVTFAPLVLYWAVPVLILWIISPVVVWKISLPVKPVRTVLNSEQKIYLRELSRKTWSFFENLVGPDDNWLPPDNLQQYPIPVIAHRTSPTNMGLALLANLSARDFGYSTIRQLIARTRFTLTSMSQLDRFRGHFYNWYDTQTMKRLHPYYISTVDSGNLAGHLLTLRQGLHEISNQRIADTKTIEGIIDTIRVALQYKDENSEHLKPLLDELLDQAKTVTTVQEIHWVLTSARKSYSSAIPTTDEILNTEAGWWLTAIHQELDRALEEITYFVPWVTQPLPPSLAGQKIFSQPTLASLLLIDDEIERLQQRDELKDAEALAWFSANQSMLAEVSAHAHTCLEDLKELSAQCFELADMEYDFLFDKSNRLFTIGYSVEERKRDAGYYDLLASEVRLGAFVAIAQGKVPQESWFALGRRLTSSGSSSVLLSWSGSMFEYLMPMLVMPTYENTLLEETCIGMVDRQIEYGRQQDVNWGISESCYNVVDSNLTYQYRAFGVPGLGFKRGLGQDLVIAPYATVMSLMVRPQEAYSNLRTMNEEGFEGRYGFYEAVDFTPSRLSRGQSKAVIKTFMVHHQGMSLLSLAYLLLDRPMQKRFEADAQFQTALLLLQEQVPKTTGFFQATADTEDITPVSTNPEMRIINTADTPIPEIQLLSNGRYHVMVTNAGGGYSRWRDTAISRWREDSTRDAWGSFCFIKDLTRGEFWSATHQPSLKESKNYEAIFSQGRVEFRRRDHNLETYTEIIVSPEDDIEVRRIHLVNHSRSTRTLEITSYSEVVLAPAASDISHPAFSNLFVQTQINPHHNAILCTRRPRSKDEQPPWMFHLMKVSGTPAEAVAYETDRSKFIGRGRSIHEPQVITGNASLSGAEGSVLDPIVSIQYRITLQGGESATIDIVTGMAASREGNQALIDKYQDKHLRDRAFELSWTHSQVVLRQIGATEADAQLYGRLAGSIMYTNPVLRANAGILSKNQRGQSALWSYSVSGDLPIVLLQITNSENILLVRQLIKAQAYWQLKGLAVDLFILNEDPSGYRQVLQDQIQGLLAVGTGISPNEKQGKVFVRQVDQVSAEDRILLQTVARVIISDKLGSLIDQVNKRAGLRTQAPFITPTKVHAPLSEPELPLPELQFFNGLGGFSKDGNEYVIVLKKDSITPLPWANVLANKKFGTIVTESGSSYTWGENAHSYRITPWYNDPVTNASGEALFVRDEESGRFWSPTPWPARNSATYIIRHGFGYSTYEHQDDGIHTTVTIHVDSEASIKFVSLKISNQSGRTRKLTATGYIEWVLGDLRSKTGMHIVTSHDALSGIITAFNAYHTEFIDRTSFFQVDESTYHYTTDRTEFLGRNGTLQNPEGLRRIRLSGKSGAGMDACAAIQVPMDIEPGIEREIVFKIGIGKNTREVQDITKKFKGLQAAHTSLQQVKEFWNHRLSALRIETPDTGINLLTNGWLIYQVLASRLWGRSGFYQSGGAFGFRDQLQDVIALLHADPQLTREQILLAASRQFVEGDVQHWWHPPLGRGVRTLCSDDLAWLPFVTARYVTATGDTQILDEQIQFLQGRPLNVNEESYYDLPVISDQRASLYEHCKRAIQRAMQLGERGIPLIGSGDWNDGMNMVGIHGKGESVWLGFFLYDVLNRFADIAQQRNEESTRQSYLEQATLLKENINKHAWDGEWYRRAYFDDGTPLGSSQNEECKIDALAQSWSVLSGAGETDRASQSMIAADKHLVNRDKKIIQLLEPPFDKTELDPGYIKGYVPGVRENGGQYTHAAIWTVMAFAKLGNNARTAELLRMINPISHGSNEQSIAVYKAEPYVMAADVYGVDPHIGRGGWTWYTGSAGWMYQLIIESFIGLKRRGDTLMFEPCVPEDWTSFTVNYRFHSTLYRITIHPSGKGKITVDEKEIPGKEIHLVDDKAEHLVVIN